MRKFTSVPWWVLLAGLIVLVSGLYVFVRWMNGWIHVFSASG